MNDKCYDTSSANAALFLNNFLWSHNLPHNGRRRTEETEEKIALLVIAVFPGLGLIFPLIPDIW